MLIQTRLLLFLLFTVLLAKESIAQGSKVKRDTTLRLLTYGLPNFEMQNAENVVAARYGFHYYGVGDCDVNQELEDSVKKVNAPVYAYLEKRHGKGWCDNFTKDVEKEFLVQKEVLSLLEKEPVIIKRQKLLEKDSNGLEYILEEITTSKYDVLAYGWGKLTPNTKEELVVYYHLVVDLKKKSVKLVSDTIRKL